MKSTMMASELDQVLRGQRCADSTDSSEEPCPLRIRRMASLSSSLSVSRCSHMSDPRGEKPSAELKHPCPS